MVENVISLQPEAGQIMRVCREIHGKPQKEIAKAMGIGEPFYSKLERGLKELTVANLVKFCQIFKLQPSGFFILVEKQKGFDMSGSDHHWSTRVCSMVGAAVELRTGKRENEVIEP